MKKQLGKIIIEKSAELSEIVDIVSRVETPEVTLEVPRFSKLVSSGSNFRILKKEADALGKNVVFESVDEKLIGFAKHHGFKAFNPFFLDTPTKKVFDIGVRPKKQIIESIEEASSSEKDLEISVDPEKEFKKEEPLSEEGDVKVPSVPVLAGFKDKKIFSFFKKKEPIAVVSEYKNIDSLEQKPRSKYKFISMACVLIFLPLLFYLAVFVFPKADIKIKLARKNWSFKEVVSANLSSAKVDFSANRIPGQVFKEQRNFIMSFPTNSKKRIAEKAIGKVIIYNTFSSASQSLVQNSRFETSDGKIYRLVKKVIVPGAKVTDGKIEASEVLADVISEVPGADYNATEGLKLKLPAFKGTPKENSIYALVKDKFTGGFVGEIASPTADEISRAKEESIKNLDSSIKSILLAKLPTELKFLEKSISFKLLKQEMTTDYSKNNSFSIFSEGETSIIGFKESDVLTIVNQKLKKSEGEDVDVKSSTINYSLKNDQKNQGAELSFEFGYDAVISKKVNIDDLRSRLSAKSESEIKALIFSVSGLQSAEVSLWPFWVKKVPNIDKINLIVD